MNLSQLVEAGLHHDLTRVALRLWRKTAAACWHYWRVRAYVSYADAALHSGQIYRNDGWVRVADVRGGTGGGNWTRGKKYRAKSVWAWPLNSGEREALRQAKTR
jgi:hypothetical protein